MRKPLALIALLAAAALADDTPPELTPHEAEYKVRVSGIGGRLTTRLEREGDTWEAVHVVEPTGFIGLFARGDIRERSRFAERGDGLLPLYYESRATLGEDSGAELSFDWYDGRVTGMYYEDGERHDVDSELAGPLFDRVSIQYRLMQDLASGRATTDDDATLPRYVLFDGDEVRPLDVSQVGERRIRTDAGTFDTVGIQHRKEGSSRRTLLWLAPELDYLPVVIEQYRHDELKVRATLREYRPRET